MMLVSGMSINNHTRGNLSNKFHGTFLNPNYHQKTVGDEAGSLGQVERLASLLHHLLQTELQLTTVFNWR